jgi:predicted phosphodiesterase
MSDIAHELVSLLKQVVSERGEVPHQNIFYGMGAGLRGKVERTFGIYSELVKAAGFEPNLRGRKKAGLTNQIFLRPLEPILEAHEPEVLKITAYQTVLCIPDTHFPFVNERVLEKIYAKAQKERPSFIVQLGDLYDLYAHSKFPRSLNLYSPVEEEQLARAGAENMWKVLRNASPDSKCVQIKGNHDIRPVRRTIESLPALEHVVSKHLDTLMSFDGVELVSDYRDEYLIDNVMYHHGYRTKLGDHRDYVLRNFVHGHTHKGGVVFRRIRDEVIWELDAGFAGDPHAKVFGYMPQKTCDYTPGFGYIDEEGPRFIPC